MSGHRIVVSEPNGVQRSRPITYRGLTVGRGEENDLVINYTAVSRNHALITFNQGRYYVTDLNSANGTYLGEAQVDPNMPTPWSPGQVLRIGDVSIQLQGGGSADSGSETFVGQRSDLAQARTQQKKGDALKWLLLAVAIAVVLVAAVVVVMLLSNS